MGLLVGTGELSRAPVAGSPVGMLGGEGESSRELDAGAVDDAAGDGLRLALGTDPHPATTSTHAAATIVLTVLTTAN